MLISIEKQIDNLKVHPNSIPAMSNEEIADWPTGTEVNYYAVCTRKLWFFSHDIQMEQESDRVALGKNIHEQSYPERREGYREWEHGPIKLDYFDPKKQIVHEVKLSRKMENAHELQVRYYLYYLKAHGFGNAHAILEYPLLKKRMEIENIENNEKELIKTIAKVNLVKREVKAPAIPAKKGICKSCSYYDFCYAGEDKDVPDTEE